MPSSPTTWLTPTPTPTPTTLMQLQPATPTLQPQLAVRFRPSSPTANGTSSSESDADDRSDAPAPTFGGWETGPPCPLPGRTPWTTQGSSFSSSGAAPSAVFEQGFCGHEASAWIMRQDSRLKIAFERGRGLVPVHSALQKFTGGQTLLHLIADELCRHARIQLAAN